MGIYNFSGKKYVYLFELDSVRNSPEEVCIGLRAMYEEIMKNGNTVVLTFNQIVDSKTFLQAIYHEKNYKYIKKLFEKGLIKISRYGETRTIAQYALSSLAKNDNNQIFDRFVFSVLPEDYQNKETYNTLFNAISFSDPNLLNDLIAKNPVFIVLKRWVDMILFLSRQEYAYHSRCNQTEEAFSTYGFLKRVLNLSREGNDLGLKQFLSAELLNNLFDEVEEMIYSFIEVNEDESNVNASLNNNDCIRALNSRSLYYNCFDELLSVDADDPKMVTAIKAAKAVMDLCYNYSNEHSILKISPHYHYDNDMEFAADFKRRFASYFQLHYVQENLFPDSNLEFLEKSKYRIVIKSRDQAFMIPKFRYPSFLSGSRKHEVVSEEKNIRLYQDNIITQRWAWRGNVFLRNIIFGIVSFLFFLLFIGVEVLYNNLQSFLAMFLDVLSVQSFSDFFANPFVKLVITVFITCALSWLISQATEKIINKLIKRKTGEYIDLHIPNFAESLLFSIKTFIYLAVFVFTRARVIQKKEKE